MFHARPARKVRAYRPCLEVLEDRNLLSTYLVDRLTDTGTGSGLAGDLRYCITNAADNDHITFGVTGTINLTGALPTLTHHISIEGPGANLVTVDGGAGHHAFQVAASGVAGISGLTVANDYINVLGSNGSGEVLGVSDCVVPLVVNGGYARVTSCTVGEIDNGGQMTVVNSTITANDAGLGAISNGYLGHLTLTNSTVSGNNIGNAQWVIYNIGVLTISSCTISGNTVDNYLFPSYGLYNDDGLDEHGTAVVRNTILAGNYDASGLEVQEVFDPGHYVQFQDANLIGGDPELGDLQDNGGPTFTMAPLPGSPALNHGSADDMTDQRGVVRTGGTNIGAYQASASGFVLTAPDTVQAGAPFDVTVKAVDVFGQTALGYTGTVTFSTTDPDPGVVLPAAYPFTAADQGTHTFSRGFTLLTPGTWTLTATDAAGGLSASVSVTVTSGGGGGGRSPNAPRPPHDFAVVDRFFAALP
jgi:hypothetical protein